MMLGREKRKRHEQGAGGPRRDRDWKKRQATGVVEEEEEEEEEEEFPAGVECEDEYEEEDVYVMVQVPPAVDGETLLSASAITVKGIGTTTPQLKVGDKIYHGKAEPIVGTTMAFVTPKAGSAGREPLELACLSTMQMTFAQPTAARSQSRQQS